MSCYYDIRWLIITKENKNIKLLAKVLDTEFKSENNVKRQHLIKQITEVREMVNKDLAQLLRTSKFIQFEKYHHQIEKIFKMLETLASFPDYIGHYNLGIVYFDPIALEDQLNLNVESQLDWMIKKNQNLPMVLSPLCHYPSLINNYSHQEEITLDEFKNVLRLWKDDVDIMQLLRAFCFPFHIKNENLTITLFPKYVNAKDPSCQDLMQFQDEILLLVDDAQQLKYAKQYLEIWQDYRPISLISKNPEVLEWSKSQKNLRSVSTDISKWRSYDTRFAVIAFKELFFEIDIQYRKTIEYEKTRIRQMGFDLEEEATSETKDLYQKIINNKKELEKEYNSFHSTVKPILNSLSEIDDYLMEKLPKGKRTPLGTYALDFYHRYWWNFCKSLAYTREEELNVIRKQMTELDSRYGYIFNIMINQSLGVLSASSDLNKLLTEKDTELICHAKIFANSVLKLSDDELMRLASNLQHYETADEYLYAGMWQMKQNHSIKAVRLLKSAFNLGSEMAGKVLLRESDTSLRWLAKNAFPEANYQEAKVMGVGKNWNYRIAAALKYPPAMFEILSFEYEQFERQLHHEKKDKVPLSDDIKQRKATQLKELALSVLDANVDEEAKVETKEILGSLYYMTKDDRRALSYLEESDSAKANYYIAKIYFNRNGDIVQDLDKAKRYAKKSDDGGYVQAKRLLDKITNEISKRKLKAKKHTPKVEVEESEVIDSGCFITTATCLALNKDDNCDELNTLRRFRDRNRVRNQVMDDLVKEYYRIAPGIVSRINEQENAQEVYKKLWEEYISKTYQAIKNNDDLRATVFYVEMVQQLCSRYNVKLTDKVLNHIKKLHAVQLK